MENIKKFITIDLLSHGVMPEIDLMQGDAFSRSVLIYFLEGGKKFFPYDDFDNFSVAFEKPDGKKGWYDELPDGTPAVEESSPAVLEAKIAPEATQVAGKVKASLIMRKGITNQIASFPFILNVIENPAFGSSISNSYYSVKNLEELNATLHDMDTDIADLQDTIADTVRFTEQTLTTDQQATARNNIGAIGRYAEISELVFNNEIAGFILQAFPMLQDGVMTLGFSEFHGIPVVLRGLSSGIDDSDAATVGQVQALILNVQQTAEEATNNALNAMQTAEEALETAGVAVITNPQTLTAEQKAQARANIGALDESVQQDFERLQQDVELAILPVVESAVTVTKQTFNDDQKAQARENIGAASRGYVDQAIADAIANLPVYNGEVEEV